MFSCHQLCKLIGLVLLISCSSVFAQNDSTSKTTSLLWTELGGAAGTSPQNPFWLRVNQYGTVPLESPFGFLNVGGTITLGSQPRKPQLKLEGEIITNLGASSKVMLPLGVILFRYRGLEMYAGRRKEVIGLGDTLMSSGFYGWSANALPLPKVQVGTRGFLPLGFTHDFVAVQATFAHGWFGKGQFAQDYFLHQKTLYVRLGKPQQKLKLYTGISHFAQWGGKAPLIKGGIAGIDGSLPNSGTGD